MEMRSFAYFFPVYNFNGLLSRVSWVPTMVVIRQTEQCSYLCSTSMHTYYSILINRMCLWPSHFCCLSQFDVDLAKDVASRQMHDDSLQKKLWLRIAKHVIEEEQNINQ